VYGTCTISMYTSSCGTRDCDLGGDHPQNFFLSSFYDSIRNLGCDACCLLGPGTFVSYFACNYALETSFGDLGIFIASWGCCCLGIVKVVVISRVWCKTLFIHHLYLKAKGLSSPSSS
jgi:hypothetical protein